MVRSAVFNSSPWILLAKLAIINGVLGQKLRYALYLRVTTSCVIRAVPSEKKPERNNHFKRLRTFCTNVPVAEEDRVWG